VTTDKNPVPAPDPAPSGAHEAALRDALLYARLMLDAAANDSERWSKEQNMNRTQMAQNAEALRRATEHIDRKLAAAEKLTAAAGGEAAFALDNSGGAAALVEASKRIATLTAERDQALAAAEQARAERDEAVRERDSACEEISEVARGRTRRPQASRGARGAGGCVEGVAGNERSGFRQLRVMDGTPSPRQGAHRRPASAARPSG
jgi:hypothetical protein